MYNPGSVHIPGHMLWAFTFGLASHTASGGLRTPEEAGCWTFPGLQPALCHHHPQPTDVIPGFLGGQVAMGSLALPLENSMHALPLGPSEDPERPGLWYGLPGGLCGPSCLPLREAALRRKGLFWPMVSGKAVHHGREESWSTQAEVVQLRGQSESQASTRSGYSFQACPPGKAMPEVPPPSVVVSYNCQPDKPKFT